MTNQYIRGEIDKSGNIEVNVFFFVCLFSFSPVNNM